MGENNHESYDYEAEKAKHNAEMDAIVKDADAMDKEMEEEENKEMEKKFGTPAEMKDMQRWDKIADQEKANEESADQKRILDEVTDRKEEDGGDYRS